MNAHPNPSHPNPARQAVSAGRVLVESLALHGVERVFCVPGESYLEVLDALHGQDRIELIVAKHEGAAANMAEADGKLTGRPGICMVTRGPGATHASIGVHIAQQDSTPMILFIGQIARGHRGREAFQEVDYQEMFGAIAKLVIEIDDEHRMGELMAKAFHAAVSGRPGPVVVALPEDTLTAATAMPACRATPVAPSAVGADALQSVAAALAAARRPLLVVGGSAWSERGIADLRAFADAWRLPVACAFRRQDIFDNNAPNFVGHMSLGMSPALQAMIGEADVILSVGSRLGDISTGGYALIEPPRARQTLILSHADAAELGRVFQADVAIHAAPDAMAAALSTLAPAVPPGWDEWTSRGRAGFEAYTARKADRVPVAGVDLTEVMLHLNEALPADAVLTNGAGNYSVWLHRYYRYRAPRTELASTCGAMGYGLPAAIAAALRLKDRSVVCVAGDGCFLMYPQELATAVQYGARLIVLVVNNGMYGTIRMHQEREYPGRVSGTRLQGPDYVSLAKAFGAYAERVVDTADFAGAFERARAAGGVGLIELVTDPLQITPDKRLASA
ncbi:thiamine pyrophosphate protein [Achromobacter denitrificans]|uniref:thiamine pyrophosphate-binding protein n=1 Tax=Achromobacter denitrificans TaxID=32002 RepID=UPI00166D001A|nr:thiamine pyrophosphate-binding protein [Achromobacter denitrificans]GFN28450.1 thiamine pyrophosphate protein [Achromobacter denitrificans]